MRQFKWDQLGRRLMNEGKNRTARDDERGE
jgi:hypothetical protein